MENVKLYKGKIQISFDKDAHKFYDAKGNSLISVTGVTSIIDKSDALMGWVAKMIGMYLLEEKKKGNDKITEQLIDEAKKEYRRLKVEAADIGQMIHEWVSDWIKGKEPEMPDNEKAVNGITAFLRFQKENKIKWLESERVIYSKKYRYAGILDAIGRKGKDLILVDFKSSNAIYPEMFLQVAGYNIAYQEETKKKITKKMIIRFGKDDGQFEVKELDNNWKDEEAFLHCLALVKRLKELK